MLCLRNDGASSPPSRGASFLQRLNQNQRRLSVIWGLFSSSVGKVSKNNHVTAFLLTANSIKVGLLINFVVSQCAIFEQHKNVFTLSVAFVAHSQVFLCVHQLPKCQGWGRPQEHLGPQTSSCRQGNGGPEKGADLFGVTH